MAILTCVFYTKIFPVDGALCMGIKKEEGEIGEGQAALHTTHLATGATLRNKSHPCARQVI